MKDRVGILGQIVGLIDNATITVNSVVVPAGYVVEAIRVDNKNSVVLSDGSILCGAYGVEFSDTNISFPSGSEILILTEDERSELLLL